MCFISVQVILSEGGVPQRPVVFVTRPVLLNLLREKLRRLQKAPGWVTVFGMAGSGKSVLAAEAVRDHGLIKGLLLCVISVGQNGNCTLQSHCMTAYLTHLENLQTKQINS